MKRVTKILTLILVAVMVLSVFSSCAMFGTNTKKYRASVAINVGDEKITIAKVSDTFYNYYSTYYSYLSQGYISIEQIFEMAVESLYEQNIKVDAYKKTHQPLEHALSDFCHNSDYLTLEETEFCINYVKYLIYTSIDEEVETKLAKDYEFAAEEEEDTSRDFTELDKVDEYASYSEYLYAQNFIHEAMEEYYAEYYASGIGYDITESKMVAEYKIGSQLKYDQLKARYEGDEQFVSINDYNAIVDDLFEKYVSSIEESYQQTLQEFLVYQAEDVVATMVANKYTYEIYKDLENEERVKTELQDRWNTAKADAEMGYLLDDDFVTSIESLGSSSFIYSVPAEYADSYIFVKNILVPFNSAQTETLSNLAAVLGDSDKDSDVYIEQRNKIAAQIIADDFLSTKDDDGNYAKVEGLFKYEGGKLVINPDGALGAYFGVGGAVTAMEGKTKTETIVELMKQYNTDVGQHTALYDYVVRVDDPANYTHKWVDEFVQASEEVAALGEGSYAVCVSDYGVHIVYYSGKVVADVPNFDEMTTPGTVAYRLFKDFYSSEMNELVNDQFEADRDNYYKNFITKTANLDKLAKDSDIVFDFDSTIEVEEEDAE